MNNPVIFLSATYDSRKSFYNKAYYTIENGIISLYSYNTLVLKYDLNRKEFIDVYYSYHSYTTNRHLNQLHSPRFSLPYPHASSHTQISKSW